MYSVSTEKRRATDTLATLAFGTLHGPSERVLRTTGGQRNTSLRHAARSYPVARSARKGGQCAQAVVMPPLPLAQLVLQQASTAGL